MMLPVYILCGGLGTRLNATYPKCMAQVQGRPFLHWQLDLLRSQGYRDITLCVGHMAEQVKAEDVRYSYDGQLGTADALRQAMQHPVALVLNGDTWLPIQYSTLGATPDVVAVHNDVPAGAYILSQNILDLPGPSLERDVLPYTVIRSVEVGPFHDIGTPERLQYANSTLSILFNSGQANR